MNFFGGFGNGMFGHKDRDCGEGQGDNNCLCSIIWIIFLLQLCGCNTGCGERGIMNNDGNCCDIILLLILLSCICK